MRKSFPNLIEFIIKRNRFRKKEDKRGSGGVGVSNGISSSVTGVDDIHLGSSPLAGSSSISAAALAAAAAAAMAGKDDTRLLKRVPPTSGNLIRHLNTQ